MSAKRQDVEGRAPARKPRAQGPDQQLEALRELLFASGEKRLRRVERKLDTGRIDADDVSKMLPRAIALREGDPEFNAALAPTVEDAIETSVRRNPKPLADAIFPIIGPAIRKAIRAALASMTEGLNQTLENSFTARGLRWRLQAWRTGKPLSEIVLLESLVYRVEQVFLVHAETGIPLASVAEPTIAVQDPDLVSAMLTALQDFVRDSFHSDSDNEGISQIEFGEHVLVVVTGPQAALAAVVRGRSPKQFRIDLVEQLERIHASIGDELASFDGDTTPFRSVRPLLELALEEQVKERKGGKINAAQVLLSLVGIAFALWAGIHFVNYFVRQADWRERLRLLREEPGIVVVESTVVDNRFIVTGLRDPESRAPEEIFAEAGINVSPDNCRLNLLPFFSNVPEFVERRARSFLDAPETVQFALTESGVLHVTGKATAAWEERLRAAPTVMLGVMSYAVDLEIVEEDD